MSVNITEESSCIWITLFVTKRKELMFLNWLLILEKFEKFLFLAKVSLKITVPKYHISVPPLTHKCIQTHELTVIAQSFELTDNRYDYYHSAGFVIGDKLPALEPIICLFIS